MAERPNAVMARQMADALSRGDMQALAGVACRPWIRHEVGSTAPLRGKAALAARSSGAVDYEITGALHDVVANDDHTMRWLTPRRPAVPRRSIPDG